MIRRLLLIATAGLLWACDDDGGICDSGDLQSALADAQPGDVVAIGSCEVTGPLTVPSGVTLAGQGIGSSIVVAPAGQAAIVLTPGASETLVRELSITAGGAAGIVARGAGSAAIESVAVTATLGVGIGAEDVTSLRLSSVTLAGPVSADNAADLPDGVGPDQSATHGLVAIAVASVALDGVLVHGFADYGVLLVESTTVAGTLTVYDNLGTGLHVEGGSATLENVSLCDALGGNRTIPPYGAVLGRALPDGTGASIEANGLMVCDNQAVGVLVVHAEAFNLTDGTFSDNTGVGLLVSHSKNTAVANSDFSGTKKATLALGGGAFEVGDGVELVSSFEGAVFENVTMSDNERVGLMIDLGENDVTDIAPPNTAPPWEVALDASGAANGARCQGAPDAREGLESWPPESTPENMVDLEDTFWDDNMTRNATAAANDDIATDDTKTVGFPDEVSAGNCCGSPGLIDATQGGLNGLGVP